MGGLLEGHEDAYGVSHQNGFFDNHILLAEFGGFPIDTRLCHFCSLNAVESEAHFMLERPKIHGASKVFVKSLKERWSRGSDPSLRKLSIKSPLARRVLEPILKVGCKFWDLFFPLLKL